MTEHDARLTRAQRNLMDVFLKRLSEFEDGLRSIGASVPSLDQQSIHAVQEWLAARSAERRAQLDDPRR